MVRGNERKTMGYQNSNWNIELLSPDLQRKIEFILMVADSGQANDSD